MAQLSAPDSIRHFARAAGYTGEPKRKTIQNGNVHIDTWSGGKSGTHVVLYSIESGGHEWPKARRKGVDATALAWEFFTRHGRKPASGRKPVKK